MTEWIESWLPFGLRQAKKGFENSKFKRKPVGCAYVEASKTIVGANDVKTSPLAARLGSRRNRIHAEVAVLKLIKFGQGTLYIYRERKDGSLGLARPCDSCMKLIREKGIKEIVYSTYSGYAREKIIV